MGWVTNNQGLVALARTVEYCILTLQSTNFLSTMGGSTTDFDILILIQLSKAALAAAFWRYFELKCYVDIFRCYVGKSR